MNFGFQIKEIHEDIILELPYLICLLPLKTQATLGLSGYKPSASQLLLNIEVGAILGSEILVDLLNQSNERFVFGLGASQGVVYVKTNAKWGIVLQAGIYEDIVNSKLYTIDVGINFGAGLQF